MIATMTRVPARSSRHSDHSATLRAALGWGTGRASVHPRQCPRQWNARGARESRRCTRLWCFCDPAHDRLSDGIARLAVARRLNRCCTGGRNFSRERQPGSGRSRRATRVPDGDDPGSRALDATSRAAFAASQSSRRRGHPGAATCMHACIIPRHPRQTNGMGAGCRATAAPTESLHAARRPTGALAYDRCSRWWHPMMAHPA